MVWLWSSVGCSGLSRCLLSLAPFREHFLEDIYRRFGLLLVIREGLDVSAVMRTQTLGIV